MDCKCLWPTIAWSSAVSATITFLISQTLQLNCQQSYRLKYVKPHNPQVFHSHCCPKHRENVNPSSERLPGHQVIACLVPLLPTGLYEEKFDLELIISQTQAHLLWAFMGIHASAGTTGGPQDWQQGWWRDVSAQNMHGHARADISEGPVWGEQPFHHSEGMTPR